MKNISMFSFGLFFLSACSGDSKETEETILDTDTEETDAEDTNTDEISILETVGSEGGTLEATNEVGTVTLEIPAGALEVEVEIGIEEIAIEDLSIAMEDLIDLAGGAYVFTPHGTTFVDPVAITLPQTGIADTILRLDDESDMTWEMVPNINFTANTASFQTSTFSVYIPVSACKAYCDNVEQLCSSLQHETCLDTCDTYNISNPPSTCSNEIADNFVCLTDATLAMADFDCTTGAPLPTTCPVEQMGAQDCTTGQCSDLSGDWYVRIAEDGATWTTNDLSGGSIPLVVKGEGALVTFADLSAEMQGTFPEMEYASVYQVEFVPSDVYGIPLPEGAGLYPNVFLSEDSEDVLKVAFMSDSSLVNAIPSQLCTPSDQSIEFSLERADGVLRVFSFERDLADGDGDGFGIIGGDCNDSDANIYPGAAEILADGIDQDCNGTIINSEPIISSSDGADAYNDSVLTCSAIGANIDGQTLSYTYSWMIDGASYSGAIQDLSVITVDPDAAVECIVMVSDTNGGTTQDSTTLTLDNRAPSVNSVSISPNTGVFSDSELTCLATVSDPDGESLSASYEWFGSGVSIGSNNTLQLSNILVSSNDSVECVATVNDGFGGSASDSSSVIIENQTPSVDSVSISPNTGVLSDSELTCLAVGSDLDGDSLSTSYEWFISGVSSGSNNTIQLSNTLVAPNDSVKCVATVDDGFGGSASDTVYVSVDNSAPIIDSSSLSPISPTRTESIVCSASASDLDGGIPALSFVFTNQGTGAIYTATSSTVDSATLDLSGTAIEYDEIVSCDIEATDLDGGSVSATETVTVINSAPVFAAEASISPNSLVYTGTELTCSATVTDADDGVLIPYYAWTSVGIQIGMGSSYTVLSEDTDVGAEIICMAMVADAEDVSITSQASVIVENTDPTVSAVQISSNSGSFYNDETVTCSATTGDIDAAPTVSYTWSRGVPLAYSQNFDLSTSSLVPLDSLTCTVEASDNHNGLASDFVIVTIGNRAPSAPTVNMTWTAGGLSPVESDDLTCAGIGSTDPDGDSVTYTYSWTSDVGGSVSGDTVLSNDTVALETWTCSVVASDGSLHSSAGTSSATITSGCGLTACDTNLDLGGGQSIDMVLIPAGDDPLVRYTLTNDFYLMTTEVTQGMFTALMLYNPSTTSVTYGVGDNYPVYYVTWYMVADFANKVTQRHNAVNGTSLQECYTCSNSGSTSVSCVEAMNPYQCSGYVLPTEGEWEYAARSGTEFDFWTSDGGGDDNGAPAFCGNQVNEPTPTIQDGVTNPPFSDYAWWCGNRLDSTFYNTAKPVGLKLPNGFGLYDMHGNVWEWTSDWWCQGFPHSDTDPYCSAGSSRVLRGGSWDYDVVYARVGYQNYDLPGQSSRYEYGFRLGRHP